MPIRAAGTPGAGQQSPAQQTTAASGATPGAQADGQPGSSTVPQTGETVRRITGPTGETVRRVTKHVGTTVAPVAPVTGQTVEKVGDAAGGIVDGSSDAVAQALSQLGS